MSTPSWLRRFARLFVAVSFVVASAPVGGLPASLGDPPPDAAAQPIQMDQIGAAAGAQYTGDGLSVIPTSAGARLRSDFQKLNGDATRGGLWVTSTVPGEDARLRLTATEFGRSDRLLGLSKSGTVVRRGKTAAYVRRGLTEEYSTSVDGVRQDFIVEQRPSGEGRLQVNLALTGATATQAARGAILTLDGSGRELAYSRLHVADATGRTLEATLDVTASDRLSIVVDDEDAVYPVRIDPTFSDADWVSLSPGVPGVLGPTDVDVVRTIAADGAGGVYVGGTFTLAGDVPASRVAKWDGSSWSLLGSGMNGDVVSLVFSGGTLYAGGAFSTAGGVAAKGVASWDGTTWSALGAGVNDSVFALAWNGSELYAGGAFTTAGGAAATRIAKWDGSNWSPVGAGMPDGRVSALAVDASGNVYAGGTFTQVAGVVNTARIAKWNGSAWSGLGTGMNGDVLALAVDGSGVLYAGGYFTSAGGVAIGRAIAKWDGTTWSGLGSGSPNPSAPVKGLTVSGTDLYVAGQFTGMVNPAGASPATVTARNIIKWNIATSRWVALGPGTPATNVSVTTVAVSGSDVFFGGLFPTVTGPSNNVAHVSHIARWSTTTSTWSALGAGMNGAVRAMALMGTDLFIGGDFTAIGGTPNSGYIAKWNGTAWSGLQGSGSSAFNSSVLALAVKGSTLYAGGSFTAPTSRIAKWDGTGWSDLTTSSGTNNTVRAIAVSSDGHVFVGGDFTTAGSTSCNRFATAKLSGSSIQWKCSASTLNGSIHALVVTSNGAIYAGGTFTSPVAFVARCTDGEYCISSVGTGVNNQVFALAASGTKIYAGGMFTTAGGAAATRVAMWNGTAWSALGTGMNGTVTALAASGTDLYAGGDFTTADGAPASRIAKWNGSAWSGLAGGVDGTARAIVPTGDGSVYVGGSFGTAGSVVSPYFALAAPVPNQAPVAVAGSDQIVPATSAAGANVTLSDAGSSDPEGDSLTYTWTEGATVVGTGATLTIPVAIGTHTFTLTVDDGNGGQASDDVVVEVRDVLSVTAVTPSVAPATFTFGQTVLADYVCTSTGGLLSTCSGTVANGAPIDTSSMGTHTFQVTATNSLGDTTTTSWTYEVVKAPSSVTVNCPASLPYTGGAQTPCTATASGAGMAPVDVSGSLIYLNNSSVGTATVSASWAGDANHNGSGGLGNFTIVTAPVTAVLTANSKVYDGTTTAPNIGLSCALTGVASVDAGNVVCSPSAGTFDNPNVGSPRSVTATLTLTGSAAGNYTFGAAGTNVTSTTVVNAPTSTTASAVYGQAGDFTTGLANNGGVSASSLASARGVAADVDGNIYVADRDNNRVLFFPFGQTTATRVYGQAGSFTTNTINNGGLSADSLRSPTRVSVDSHGGLYISDPGNFRVLYFPAGSTTATRVYGQLGSFTSAVTNNGGISADSLGSPRAVAIDADDNVYIADANNNRVLFYPAGSTTATRVYGQNGSFTTGIVNNTTGVAGVISAESLNTPNGIRLDTDGNLYVVDQQNHRVLMYPAGQTTATVVYGQGGNFTTNIANNGGISADSLSTPSNLAVDGGNNVYVADQANARVLFFPSGQTTATVVYGQGGSFASGTPNNGGASADSLANPNSVDLDFAGNIYVSDFGNNRVLRFTGAAPAITPAPLTISAVSITKTYGSEATITPTFDGFVGGETSAVLTSAPVCTSAGAAAGATVGTYAITCAGAAADNYTIAYVAATLTVDPKSALVTSDAATKVYGSDDPVLTGTISGFLPGDGVTAVFSRVAGETVAGGPYPITATLSPAHVLSNYAIVYETADFTITKASQAISLGAAPSDGVPDAPFRVSVGAGFNDRVTSAVVQPDGKIVVGGLFTTFDGVAANRIIRLHPDGTRDTSFSTGGSGFDHQVNSVALQSDGKIIVGGQFQNLNGAPARRIARLNQDGTPDATFTTNTGTGFDQAVLVVLVQPDDKILASGYFFRLNGVLSREIARINADGTPDVAFRTNLAVGFAGCCIYRMALQPDGKIVVIGDFHTFNLQPAANVARINADGTPDVAFISNTGAGLNAGGSAVAVLSDGKILLGGSFTTVNNVAAKGIARLNGDGTPDTAYSPGVVPFFNAGAFAVQSDGKIVAGSAGYSKRLARLNADGTLDTVFDTNLGTGLNAAPEQVVLQPDGAIVLVGPFTSLNGAPANRIARLLPGSGAITRTYGDAAFTVSASASSGLPVSFSSTTPGVCTIAGNTVTIVGAGTCTVAADQAGDSNYHAAPTLNQDVTVNKAASTTTVTCPVSVPFDGTAQTPCTATTTGAGGFSESTTVTYIANTNAGTATANATYPGGANHNASTGAATFTIARAPLTATLVANGKVYDGTTAITNANMSCTIAGVAVGDLEHVACVATAGAFDSADAGARTVTATATITGAAAGNYTFGAAGTAVMSISASTPATISKAASTTTVSCPTSVTYTGAAQEVCSATVTGAGGLSEAVTVSYTDNTNAGTASASASFGGDANHEPSTGSGTFTIGKAASTTTVSCPTSVTFTGAAQEVCTATVTGAGGLSETVTVTYTDNTNAGTASASATFGGDANHEPSTGSGSFTIGKASSTTTVSCPTSAVTYTGAAQEVCTATVTGAGGLSETVTVTYTDNTNAGTASASASFGGDANHEPSTGSGSFTIGKASSTTTVSCPTSAVTYTGAAQDVCTATVTGAGGLSEAVTVTYTDNTNAGTASASASFGGDANHESSTGAATFTIGKAASSTKVSCPTSVTYTGAAQEICTATVTGAGGLSEAVTVTYTDNTNAGTATASASFAGDANHESSTGSGTFTIGKAASTTTVSCPTSVTFTGAPQEVCSATVTGAGGLSEAVTVTYTDNSNAGTASASATFAGGANHEPSTGSATFTIGKAASTTTVSCPTSVTYTGAAQEVCSATVTGAGGLSEAVTVSYTDNTNAGTASASASFGGDANHESSTGSGTFTIGKAASTTTVSCPNSVTYTGTAQEVCSATVTGAGGLSEAVTVSYTDNTNAGTASASASFGGDANHESSTGAATFTIGKASSTTTVSCPTSVTFTGLAMTPCSVLVTGVGGFSATPSPTYTNNVVLGTATASYDFAGDGNHEPSTDSATFTIVAVPPVLTVPTATTVEATGATGAVHEYTAEAVDPQGLSVLVSCTPESGSTFALGETAVTCTATNAAGLSTAAQFTVTVVDSTAPAITTSDVSVVATDAAGAVVEFAPTAVDLVDGALTPACSPTSGSTFTIGVHTVSCSATDAAGNGATETFEVQVIDGVLPVVVVPASVSAEATSATGTSVTFEVTATDNIDEELTVACLPASGTNFPIGATTVHCSTVDAAGNTGVASFTVTVADTAAPTLTLPSLVTETLDSGTTRIVTFTATAIDVVDGAVTPSCAPASGSAFPVGDTTVTCSATDAAGNTATGTFTVHVNDGRPPVVTVTPSGNQTVEATSSSGALATFAAAAVDAVGTALPVTCSTPSGSTFSLGTTTVTCSATNSYGNIGTASFDVTVVDTTAPQLSLPEPINATADSAAGVAVSYVASATDLVDGTVAASCSPASGTTFPVGITTVSCSTTDARGNATAGAFTVTVAVEENQLGRFVVLSRDGTWLREKAKVISGDVGANERRFHQNDHGDEDGDRNDVTVRVGEGVTMEQAGSRVVGSTVLMLNKSSLYDVVTNALLNKRGTVRGIVDSPMSIPFTSLPSFPTVLPGWNGVEVARNKTSTLGAGRYGDVVVKSGATLVLTGGLYQLRSLELEQNATLLFRGPSEVRVKLEVHTGTKSKMILDRNVPGLRASQMVIYVEGDDSCGRRGGRDDDGDDAGQVTVHIGQQSTVQASIYAQAGTIWLKSKTQATGAFIGMHVRIGQRVTLTLDSAFR